MKKIINFGKVAYGTFKNKRNAVEIEVEFLERNDNNETYNIFSASGAIWNTTHTDMVCGGQCLDEIAKYRDQLNNPELFDKVYTWWKKYHLNNMHAGTPEQEKAIEEWKAQGNKYSYVAACEYLKSINLYEVPYTGKAIGKVYNGELYRYGSAWLIEYIPENDLKDIISFMATK